VEGGYSVEGVSRGSRSVCGGMDESQPGCSSFFVLDLFLFPPSPGSENSWTLILSCYCDTTCPACTTTQSTMKLVGYLDDNF
jgi:hypothetical protein